MTKYREILRLTSLGLSQQSIADSCGVSKKTVNRVLKKAAEEKLFWPLDPNLTDAVIAERFFPSAKQVASDKKMPDFAHVRKELLRNGVSKKLLWSEYMEECRQSGGDPLMYSQFCHYIRQDEQKRRATMHIDRKPGEQVEVDWAGDPAYIIDPDTGEATKAFVFVGVLSYSQYPYVEAFLNEQQSSWIAAHIHMYEYFGGVAKLLVPDNCATAVNHGGDWHDPRINAVYREMAEHMPADHQQYLEWNGNRFRKWGAQIGTNTGAVVQAILSSQRVEQQSYRSCMALLKLTEKYSEKRLEAACKLALSYTASPSYKNIKDILASGRDKAFADDAHTAEQNPHAMTRGADYYRR